MLNKRVVIYGINYAPEIAGVGRYSGEIGEHFAAEGHDVCVVTAPPHYPGWAAKAPYSARRYVKEIVAGAEVYRCPLYLHPNMRGIRRLLAPLSFALSSAPVALWQILKRRPNVVLTVEPTLFTAPLALLAAKLVGAKTVLHVQDLEIEAAFAVGHLGKGGLLAKAAAFYDRLVNRAFDRVITISHRMAEKIVERGVDSAKIAVIRNWVDLERIRPQATSQAYRRELGLKPNDFVVLYSGNIGAKQGVGLLIDAARELQDRPDIVFAIAGQGPMRPQIDAAAAELPNIRAYDFQPEARFSEFLSIANLHVLPQERDAADLLLPSKLGGILASGRQIVVTADPGTELALFLGTSCVLSAPGDATALAGSILLATGTAPCPEQRAQRLRLAGALGKPALIADFTRAALFLQPPEMATDTARQAA